MKHLQRIQSELKDAKSMQKISKYLTDTANTQGVSAELEQRNEMTVNEPAWLPACQACL